jgi:hypothetical protein
MPNIPNAPSPRISSVVNSSVAPPPDFPSDAESAAVEIEGDSTNREKKRVNMRIPALNTLLAFEIFIVIFS